MIVSVLIVQLGFAIILPREGPLLPYRDCVAAVLARSSADDLDYGRLATPLETECGTKRDAALPALLDQAVAQVARSGAGPITREELERQLPRFLELGVRSAIDDELRARGIDRQPMPALPAIPRPGCD